MLHELRVRELGVIADLEVSFAEGLTAITGETGAGKTLVVDALELLVGGRADPQMVRAGAEEAIVEGRFEASKAHDSDRGTGSDPDELIICRIVARTGKSRATLNGKMVPITGLEEQGQHLLDLYGQHGHQSLLRQSHQRRALDRYGDVDLAPVEELRKEVARIDKALAELGGSHAERARELDLVIYERDEIERAAIRTPNEDDDLKEEEERLSSALDLQQAIASAYELLSGGENAQNARDRLALAAQQLASQRALEEFSSRAVSLGVELDDLASELRRASESFEEDPERLAAVQERRQILRNLMRKFGPELGDVLATYEERTQRAAHLEGAEERRTELVEKKASLLRQLQLAEELVGGVRREKSVELAGELQHQLQDLGLAKARIEVRVGEGIGDDAEIYLGANPGEPTRPLAKVASGGELSRTMLALRLVLGSSPPTLIFDEVDAGIGGSAALAVGRALAELARERQVIVVTHLAQVAAFAKHQFVVTKHEDATRTTVSCAEVHGEDRVVELSRMLSGQPDSKRAHEHAAELLELANTGKIAQKDLITQR